MTTPWRLIPHLVASGHAQMVIDEWLLEQHRVGKGPPCLRFYSWQPIAISLGYHQRHYPAHWQGLHWQGQPVDLVRRPSGGRAVLHQGDLTYSLISSGHGGRRRDVYSYLCKFLIEGWRSLGISLSMGGAQHRYQSSVNCFGTATTADLVMDDGYKLIGSAQLYRDKCVLQHGSMRLAPNPELVNAVFGTPAVRPSALVNIQPQAIMEALIAAAEHSFRMRLESQPISCDEQRQAMAWGQAKQIPLSAKL